MESTDSLSEATAVDHTDSTVSSLIGMMKELVVSCQKDRADHLRTMSDMLQQHQEFLRELNQEHQQEILRIRVEYEEGIQRLQEQHRRELREMQQRLAQQFQRNIVEILWERFEALSPIEKVLVAVAMGILAGCVLYCTWHFMHWAWNGIIACIKTLMPNIMKTAEPEVRRLIDHPAYLAFTAAFRNGAMFVSDFYLGPPTGALVGMLAGALFSNPAWT